MQTQFIDGVYNYCDRWCTYCNLSTRCRVYDKERESRETNASGETDIWEEVKDNLTEAMVLLEKISFEHGFDQNKELDEKELVTKVKAKHLKDSSRNHDLAILAGKYWQAAKAFFDDTANITRDAYELAEEVALGIRTRAQGDKKASDITKNFEIIQWYMFFIDAKLQRALYGLNNCDEREDEVIIDAKITDSNGSAKVALIAIEKSMSAWKNILEIMPSAEDCALKCLGILAKLKAVCLTEFPHAMEFIRPGFD